MLLSASKGRINEALQAGDSLLKIDGELNSSWTQRFVLNCFLYQIAMGSPKTEAKARQYLRSRVEIGEILHPYFEDKLTFENLLNHPEAHEYAPNKNKLEMVMKKMSYLLNDK